MKPVLFELSEAQRLVKHYNFLKGQQYNILNEQHSIIYVLVAPYNPERFSKFLEEFLRLKDNMEALLQSGYNSKELQVILIDEYSAGVVVYAELNEYLTNNNIAKIYDVDLML